MADLNRYMAATRLVIISMDDAIKHTGDLVISAGDVISISRTIHGLFFRDFSLFRLPVKGKGTEVRKDERTHQSAMDKCDWI